MKVTTQSLPPLASPWIDGDESSRRERLVDVFVGRLRRLLRLRAERAAALNDDGVRLIDHAIFSTYCDCKDLGAEALARGLIDVEVFDRRPAGSEAR